jgi:hypothetical protein
MPTSEIFLSFMRRLIFCFFLIVLGATASHAQNAGNVGIYTREVTVFTAQSTTKSSAILPDFGFAAHNLTYCNSAFQGSIDFEYSPTGPSPFVPVILTRAAYPSGITATDSACHVLQLGGYYPNLRVTVTPTAGSLSATYSASAAPIPIVSTGLGTFGPSPPIVCDQNSIQSVATGNTATIGNIGPYFAGDTIVICSFSIAFNAATTTGQVSLNWGTSVACSTLSGATWEAFTTASSPQFISVPVTQRSFIPATSSFPCFQNSSGAFAVISISYASVHGL